MMKGGREDMKIFTEHGLLANAEEMLVLEKSQFCNKGN